MPSVLGDLASIKGVRQNQLIGYGLAVGLDGSGDQTTQTPFTTTKRGSTCCSSWAPPIAHGKANLQLKNVVLVVVTASCRPLRSRDKPLDVTVLPMGNAKRARAAARC